MDAARRQLNASVLMYFNDIDPVAVHAVCAGATQILTDLGAKKGLKLGLRAALQFIRRERREELSQIMREPQNHIKHADRPGDEDKILEYRPGTLEFYIFMAVDAYEKYTGESTPEARVFWLWFSVNHPDILLESVYKQQIEDFTGKFGSFTAKDKELCLKIVDTIRTKKNVTGINYN